MIGCDFLYLICAKFDLLFSRGGYSEQGFNLDGGLRLGTDQAGVSRLCCGQLSDYGTIDTQNTLQNAHMFPSTPHKKQTNKKTTKNTQKITTTKKHNNNNNNNKKQERKHCNKRAVLILTDTWVVVICTKIRPDKRQISRHKLQHQTGKTLFLLQ